MRTSPSGQWRFHHALPRLAEAGLRHRRRVRRRVPVGAQLAVGGFRRRRSGGTARRPAAEAGTAFKRERRAPGGGRRLPHSGRRSGGSAPSRPSASPPAPAAGLTGVEFLIASLDPQIEEASFDLNRRFGIDPNVAGRSPARRLRPAGPAASLRAHRAGPEIRRRDPRETKATSPSS